MVDRELALHFALWSDEQAMQSGTLIVPVLE